MKNYKGKAIYNPSGSAGEYSYWTCNFYNGCSNGCTYCYLRKGIFAHTMGGDKPTLKKCFRDKGYALKVFEKELKANLPALQEHGLFFSFTTDPCLPDTIGMTLSAIDICLNYDVNVKLLTKCTSWIKDWIDETWGGGDVEA
jgi:DNA repair photolyase